MKKVFALMMLLAGLSMGSYAQDVYTEVLRLSKKGAADKTKSLDMRRVAQFKVNALEYMAIKTKELMPDSTVRVLDEQAYALYDFIDNYFKYMSMYRKQKNRDMVQKIFMEATMHHPRFNEPDTELNLSYYNNTEFPTPFCLDTDWVKARKEALMVVAQMK